MSAQLRGDQRRRANRLLGIAVLGAFDQRYVPAYRCAEYSAKGLGVLDELQPARQPVAALSQLGPADGRPVAGREGECEQRNGKTQDRQTFR